MIGSPKRREIGHGRLAKRGVAAVMPSLTEVPYVVRVVPKLQNLMVPHQWLRLRCFSGINGAAGVPIKLLLQVLLWV